MSHYIEPFILFALGVIVNQYQIQNVHYIVMILLAIIFISLLILAKHNYILNGITIASILLSIIFPPFITFLPSITYIPFFQKKYIHAISIMIPSLILFQDGCSFHDLFFLMLFPVSFYMSYQTFTRHDLTEQLKALRDNAVEQELSLKEKNRRLASSQNDEIYIATLTERNRIAREIHDNVGHMLSSSLLQVGALLAVCKDDTMKGLLSTLKDTLNQAMTSIRSSVHDLHDESIDLAQAIQQLGNDFTFCPITINCNASKTVPKEIKYCFISITKEALNNIMKHSNATKASVTLKEHPGFYRLCIEDNGTTRQNCVIDLETLNGIGLGNMKERIDSLGGIFKIQTENGFRIFISVPKSDKL